MKHLTIRRISPPKSAEPFAKVLTEKLCTSAPRDAEGVKGQTNIPFCIEFHALSNGDVSFTVATNPNFNMTPKISPKI